MLTTIRRYTENHEHLVTFKSLCIVTLENGHWGVEAGSSLAPRQIAHCRQEGFQMCPDPLAEQERQR